MAGGVYGTHGRNRREHSQSWPPRSLRSEWIASRPLGERRIAAYHQEYQRGTVFLQDTKFAAVVLLAREDVRFL